MAPTVVRVPGSKSLTQRALIAAALAQGQSFIGNALIADDTCYLADGLRAIGARVVQTDDGFSVLGTAGKIINSGKEIFLGSNGTALRFMTALVTLGRGKYVLSGTKRLCQRPVGALTSALREMGVNISCDNNHPPVAVNAAGLKGGKLRLNDLESSQYVSALLLCAPYSAEGIEFTLAGSVASAPYIDLTVSVMRDFGAEVRQQDTRQYHVEAGKIYQGRQYCVEGDVSSASYFFLAAALLRKTIRVQGISRRGSQGDGRILNILEELGCAVHAGENWIEVSGSGLTPGDFIFDLNDMPDMVPTLAVLAAFRKGRTTITNVAHLRLKESDRLGTLACELSRIGIVAQETTDGLVIQGGKPQPAQMETYDDHRLAMSFAIARLVCRGIEVTDKKCVNKSFPGFWEELKKV